MLAARRMLQSSALSCRSSSGAFPSSWLGDRGSSLFAFIPSRPLIINFPEEGVDLDREAKSFGRAAVECGAESYPSFRHEYMKPYEKRFQGRKRKEGGKSIRKVRGLVDFINFKRANKYQ